MQLDLAQRPIPYRLQGAVVIGGQLDGLDSFGPVVQAKNLLPGERHPHRVLQFEYRQKYLVLRPQSRAKAASCVLGNNVGLLGAQLKCVANVLLYIVGNLCFIVHVQLLTIAQLLHGGAEYFHGVITLGQVLILPLLLVGRVGKGLFGVARRLGQHLKSRRWSKAG